MFHGLNFQHYFSFTKKDSVLHLHIFFKSVYMFSINKCICFSVRSDFDNFISFTFSMRVGIFVIF